MQSSISDLETMNNIDMTPMQAVPDISTQKTLPTWIPVLFGIITPMSFTANQMLAKSFRRGPIRFNMQDISFSGFFAVNIIILFPTIYYWLYIDFNKRLFIVGLIGSIINTFGKVCV